jgi:hypothetical protein
VVLAVAMSVLGYGRDGRSQSQKADLHGRHVDEVRLLMCRSGKCMDR